MYAMELGRRLKAALNTAEAYDILGDEGTWQAGGCWILAAALKRLLGKKAKLFAVVSHRNPAEHVVVEWDGLYIDADGASTEAQLLRRMRDEEFIPSPMVVPFNRNLQQMAKSAGDVPCPIGKVKELESFLRVTLSQ